MGRMMPTEINCPPLRVAPNPTIMITISVKLYGSLRRYRPETVPGEAHHAFEMTLPEGATVAGLIAQLGINEGMVSAIAVNGTAADQDCQLQIGDDVRLFPPSAGGQGLQIFIAGIMQGSRQDHLIDAQHYRARIAEALARRVPDVRIIDPYALHPDSVNYGAEQVRETFESMTAMAGDADLVIAYLPEASMGTAIEMWTAHKSNKSVIAVTQLRHNWVVRLTANEILPDLEALIAAIDDGLIERVIGR